MSTTGDVIGQDIAAIEKFLEPFLAQVPSPVTQGILMGMKLLSVAEPAIYNVIASIASGKDLTPEQTLAKDQAIARLMNPEKYFS